MSAWAWCAVLLLSEPRPATAETSLQYKFQDYAEDDARIHVRAHYALASLDLDPATQLRASGVLDTITGASPTGQPAPPGSRAVPLGTLKDRRWAAIADLTRAFATGRARFEYAYSIEHDYRSRGYTGTWVQEFNDKNTELQLGLAYTDDDVFPAFLDRPRRKLSRDYLIGITQLLDAATVFTVNLTYGKADGYLADPYKIVRKTTEIAPGLSLPLTFPENRPGRREKVVVYTELKRHFPSLHGSADLSYRHLDDDQGIASDTVDLTWLQRLGERWIVQPSFRYYRQDAADYYHYDLDPTPIVPAPQPPAGEPFYSSDYRLSAFRATTWGLKVIYGLDDQWSVDVAYERYAMRGRDGITPASAYASADIITLGARLWY